MVISAAAGKAGAMVGAFGFLYAAQSQDRAKTDKGYPPGVGMKNSLTVLGVISLLGMLFTFLVPESKGKSLEEMSQENEGEMGMESRPQDASVLECGTFPASFDEAVILKNKSEEIEPYLNGRCIYLVGMMGSGKTTIGRILSEVLGYSFFDCDRLIEQSVGGTSVADIFKLHGESFFRDNETEVLQKLSSMQRLVISTGGGAVVRPVNWKHMQKGISVWLDVPLEALARRITAVGTDSRPLLHNESGDAYTKTFRRLCTLWEERSEAYTNANARVSLENIAAKLGFGDVCNLTPTEIAIEALVQIEYFLKK